MSNVKSPRTLRFGVRSQRGVATLLVTLSVLIILTIIILSSSNVALFEQKTATNENREHLAEQSAEYALNLGGEYLKANVSKISTNASGGWLNPSLTSLHWRSCVPVTDTTHPCFMEANTARRQQLYYYTSDGAVHTDGGNAALDLFATANLAATAGTAALSTVGGTASFPATATVYALMCRVDATSTLAQDDHCRRTPAKGRQIAITLIATSHLTGENASAVVKETWGTINKTSFSASTPLVASGTVKFVGTFTVVAAPNAGGYGIPASVWSPNDATENGGSMQSCYVEDYLDGLPESELFTNPGCADTHTCSCNSELLTQSHQPDGVDILDRDGNSGANPDITFFPGGDAAGAAGSHSYGGTRRDYREVGGVCPSAHPYCDTDDNLFEWIFGVDVTGGDNTAVAQNCTVPAAFGGGGDCELAALSDMNFAVLPDCSTLDSTSSGLFYITGTCNPPHNGNPTVIGDPSHPVILVVNDTFSFGHVDDFFGMVFVRNEENNADVSGNGAGKLFGSIVVEGTVQHMNGTMDLVYMDTSAGNPDDPLPDTTRFARLPNSWLDNATGF
jgi:hypothetical protein